jgi:predicted GIY-YIG superfamily endonuclease
MSAIIKWTYDTCKIESSKYKTIIEFRKNEKWAYHIAVKNGWLYDFFGYDVKKNNKSNYWTKEKCIEVALMCKTKTDFKSQYGGAYMKAYRNEWLDDICSHMEQIDKPRNYWSKAKCAEIAKCFNNKTDFRINEAGAYDTSYKNKWLDSICSHMEPIGNLYKRLIYSVEFDDKSIYIGLTCNSKRRKNEHIKGQDSKNTAAFNYKLKTGLNPIFTELTDYLDVKEAIKIEEFYVNYYRKLGYNILNKNKTGGIGWSPLKIK